MTSDSVHAAEDSPWFTDPPLDVAASSSPLLPCGIPQSVFDGKPWSIESRAPSVLSTIYLFVLHIKYLLIHSFSKLKYFSLTHALPLDFLLCERAQLKLKTSSVLWKSDWKQLWAVMDCKQWSLDFWQKAAVLKLQSYLNILQKHSLYFFPLCSWLNWLRFKGLID